MTIGERIEERRKALGIKSQSELARLAGMRQSTLSGIIRKSYRWSPYLTALARALLTTVEYLVGEIDDPDLNAPLPPPPLPHTVSMNVVMPPERALARMFEALLDGIDPSTSRAEQALLLAQMLPISLSQLRDLQPASWSPPTSQPTAASVPEPHPIDDPALSR